MESINTSKTTGIVGTVVFHGAIVLLLLLFGLQPQLPIPPEEGILINFGDSEVGMGAVEPSVADKVVNAAPPQQQAVQDKEPLTQDFEDAPTLQQKKKQPRKEAVKTPVKTPQKVVADATPAPAVEKPREVNKRALFPGKSTSNLPSQGEGEGAGRGNQGDLNGSPDSGSRVGGSSGGGGTGHSFSLAGRKVVGGLPNPSYGVQASGKVVIAITVDKNGRVMKAEYSPKGSTTQDSRLVSAALAAAQKARFNVDQNAASIQSGNITYIFNLN